MYLRTTVLHLYLSEMAGVHMNTMIAEAVAAPTAVPTERVKRVRRSKEEVVANKKYIATQKNEREITKKLVLFEKQKRALDKDMLLLEQKKRKLSDTENALKNLKSAQVQAKQPQVTEPHVHHIHGTDEEDEESQANVPSDDKSDSEESDDDLDRKKMANYMASKVDILSEENIRKKIPDIPTCRCGGHSVCLGCKTKWNITLTQEHCTHYNCPPSGDEFVCLKDEGFNGDGRCFFDEIGLMPCVLCLDTPPPGPNNMYERWRTDCDPFFLIGEHARCPGCCSMVGDADECEMCSYPTYYMNK